MSDLERTDSDSDNDMETEINIHEADNSDDDSDSELSEDEDARKMQSYVDCLGEIEKSKYNYDSYVELLDLAHSIGELDKIRESYELFASVFPLAPEHWLKWIRLELNIAVSPAEVKKVFLLFQRALSDYYSSEVALELANLALKSPKSDDVWEQLLSTYTLHCLQGRSIFDAYKLYLDKQDGDKSEEYYKKLIEAYESQLSLPLKDMEETYIELKLLCEKQQKSELVDWSRIDLAYNKAKEQLQKILPFEKRLAELDAKSHQNRAAIYFEYIECGRQFLNDRIVQVLYERMVTECCLNVSCWLSYIKYIQSRDGHQAPQTNGVERPQLFSQTEWDIINRAIRNCTWTASVYIEKMRIAERMELNRDEVKGVLEHALSAGFPSAEQYVSIWLEYLTYLRRNTAFTCEKECEIIRATFTMAWDLLGRQFGVLADCECEILQFWGRLEYGPLSDLAKGKQLWTTVMESADNSAKSALWIEFAHLEMKKGPDGARKVFRKALTTEEIDNINVIASAWIRFERCNGTLAQLRLCEEACEERLASVVYKAKVAAKTKNLKRKSTRSDPSNVDADKTASNAKTNAKTNAKAKTNKNPAHSNPNSNDSNSTEAKRRKAEKLVEDKVDEVMDTSRDDVTIFISNLDYSVTGGDIIEAFPEFKIVHVNIKKSVNGNSRGFGYVQLESAADVEKSLLFDRRPIKGRPAFISSVLRDKEKRNVFKYAECLEKTKLFVKGLSFATTKEDLETLFKEFGTLKDVRLVYQKTGVPKGLAYIEYETESSASDAVFKMNDYELKGHKMSVSISNPPPKPNVQSVKSEPVSLGQGRRNVLPRSDAKPRLSFIPRSVQKNVLELSSNNAVADQPKSNEDFRKLLNKK